MIIRDYRLEAVSDKVRITADVAWEETARKPFELTFDAPWTCARHAVDGGDALAIACLHPALHLGEKRLKIETPVCPQLRNSLKEVQAWYRHWFEMGRPPLIIEAPDAAYRASLGGDTQSALLLSGGVDSLAALRHNMLTIPEDHPARIRRCFVVYGFDIGWSKEAPAKTTSFERVIEHLRPVAENAGVELVPVYTNVRHIEPDPAFWVLQFHGAALASVAHALRKGLLQCFVAGSHTVSDAKPWGSNPVTDPMYSSAELHLRYDGVLISRYQKLKLLTQWEPGFHNLRVCTTNPADKLNCCRCEKCVRTMFDLMLMGKLAECAAFEDEISADMVDGFDVYTEHQAHSFSQLIPLLEEMDRTDLSDAIKKLTHRYEIWTRKADERDWRGMVKKLDRRLLGGELQRTWRLKKDSK